MEGTGVECGTDREGEEATAAAEDTRAMATVAVAMMATVVAAAVALESANGIGRGIAITADDLDRDRANEAAPGDTLARDLATDLHAAETPAALPAAATVPAIADATRDRRRAVAMEVETEDETAGTDRRAETDHQSAMERRCPRRHRQRRRAPIPREQTKARGALSCAGAASSPWLFAWHLHSSRLRTPPVVVLLILSPIFKQCGSFLT